ncbi:TPA: beta family protein [Morganella morganii subsp. morganii]|uniref:Protein beta n=1 Tax=Morganella morganii TaxID=582 RepID=A0AAU8ZKS1_MORMO|nr:beta family protein [Morganella morganii]AWC93609.1 protein beta [Morganella morganii]EKW8486854.1 beta family protein [Morganella morganii]HDU8692483.1 beta family protein [Morganella morganii subsp. morganii]
MLFDNYSYIPILSLKPAEMAALEELPYKDKNLILPLISLKKWANSKSLIKSVERIKKAFGDNYWIADLDKEFFELAKERMDSDDSPVYHEFVSLSDPTDGYLNWTSFISKYDNIIPTIQIGDIDNFELQLNSLLKTNKPLVIRFEFFGKNTITTSTFREVIKKISKVSFNNGLLIILDYGDVNRLNLIEYYKYSNMIKQLYSLLGNVYFCISGTSFPYHFAGSYRGEIPIYERLIYNKIIGDCEGIKLIYSDRGSTRALKNEGGGGTPPPRIDYPLKNDWRFIRKELDSNLYDKEQLYQNAAIEMIKMDYWDNSLRLWGVQMIEKTSIGDPYGITSASRATAVRINIHIYQQLHYMDKLNLIDTEEDWVD